MEDNLNYFCKWKTTLFFFLIERGPQKTSNSFVNGGRPHRRDRKLYLVFL